MRPSPQKNIYTLASILAIAVMMVGASFAAVPLYRIFCSVTGFGGTTQISKTEPSQIDSRTITIRFDANTAKDLLWDFLPEQKEVKIHLGEKKYISYRAESFSHSVTSGTALFNVTPSKAGKYFKKIQCFCFQEQSLMPGEKVNMPVLFFIDPELDNDQGMKDVHTITLSYSFFKMDSQSLERGLEDFYNQEDTDKSDTNITAALTE